MSTTSHGSTFPRQKLSEAKKTDKWHKECVDFAESMLESNDLRSSIKNKQVNYNLRANIIDKDHFDRLINPDKLDMDSLPANFQHIGIENTKINLLLGEYSKRKKNFKAYLSSNDTEGISRREKDIKKKYYEFAMEKLKAEELDEQTMTEEVAQLSKYIKYDYQDIAEITANRLLKKEFKENNYNFTFLRTFEDLLTVGEQIMYIGVLGGKPVMRRVDPRNVFTSGGSSLHLEDSDVICEFNYQSVGQAIDDYWDVLTEKDIKKIEENSSVYNSSRRDRIGGTTPAGASGDAGLSLLDTNDSHVQNRFSKTFDANGNIRVLRTCWRSRRKIGKLKYYDEQGEVQYTWVSENYQRDEFSGEEIDWKWVNEWRQGVKLGDSVYCDLGPIPFSSKSLVNKSKGLPPYIGIYNSTNEYKVQSLMDIMRPLSYSYDIAYYKRDLEIATHFGSFTAINSSMIPSGWEPEQWIHYAKVNKFAFLDPTNEILKGPSQGKSAGAFNTLTAANISVDNSRNVQMFTDLMFHIESTMGKVAGVTGAREGQIQNREAVNNVEREVTQTSHITEKWFQLDSEFMRRVIKRFLEACKHAYKDNPQNGQYILDDMGMEMVSNYSEFAESDFDVHVSDSGDDKQLYDSIMRLTHAAIQNGQATLSDAVTLFKSESVQEVSVKLAENAEATQKRAEEMQTKQMESNEKIQQAMLEDKKVEREWEKEKFNLELADKREQTNVKREKILMDAEVKEREGQRRQDTNFNGIADEIDKKILDNQMLDTKLDDQTKQRQLEETIRHNKAQEEIDRMKISKAKK